MTGGGQGTGVPGVTSGVPTPGGYGIRYFRNEALSDRLGDLEIPDDEVDNYVETLESRPQRRCVLREGRHDR